MNPRIRAHPVRPDPRGRGYDGDPHVKATQKPARRVRPDPRGRMLAAQLSTGAVSAMTMPATPPEPPPRLPGRARDYVPDGRVGPHVGTRFELRVEFRVQFRVVRRARRAEQPWPDAWSLRHAAGPSAGRPGLRLTVVAFRPPLGRRSNFDGRTPRALPPGGRRAVRHRLPQQHPEIAPNSLQVRTPPSVSGSWRENPRNGVQVRRACADT